MRRTAAVVLCVPAALLMAFVLGEYELGWVVALAAGVVVGLLLAELVVGVGGRTGPVPAAVAAVAAGGCLVLAGWIDSTQGVEPYPVPAAVGALAGAAVAFVRAVATRP